jgi:RNA polymerase sigma factor (sigma-70 family)
LLRFCRSRAGPDRGDDVFQETMLAALRAYDTVRDPTTVKTWLFSIAARKAIDAHRATARAPTPVADPEPGGRPHDEPGDAADPAARLDDPALWDEVARLPPKQREAVTLRFMADLTHREIATVMQTSEAAARRNVFEGLRRLREGLAGHLV